MRGRDFRLLLASSALSALGDELALIALTIKVANLTGSGISVAALLLAGLLPLVIFAPAAGVIVDNFETTRTLAIATAIQAVLAVALAFTTGLPTILMLAFLLGSCAAVANPAIYTLVPSVVGEEDVTPANAYLESARYVGMISGPVLAGTISAGVGTKVALLVNAGTFVVIAISALALRTRRHPEGSEEGAKGEARAGIGLVGRDRLLVVAFTVFGAIVLFGAMDNVAEVFFARDALGAGDWGYGLLAAAWIAGLVVGAAGIARRLPDDRLMTAMMTAGVVAGTAVTIAAVFPTLWLALPMFFIGGAANGVVTVPMKTVIVRRVPDRNRGRVFAAYGAVAYGVQIVTLVAAGAAVVRLGGRGTLVVGGVGMIVAGLGGLVWYRSLPTEVRAMPESEEVTHLPEIGELVDTIEVMPHPDMITRLPDSEPAIEHRPDTEA